MSESVGSAICRGCFAVVPREELVDQDYLCNFCEYEREAKLDNLTDDE